MEFSVNWTLFCGGEDEYKCVAGGVDVCVESSDHPLGAVCILF